MHARENHVHSTVSTTVPIRGRGCSEDTIEGTMASYNRSTSAPAVDNSGGEASVDGFPPVLVLYHPSMEMLARNIVEATTARTKKLSLSEASCINAGSYSTKIIFPM